jgi:hypothetical protein
VTARTIRYRARDEVMLTRDGYDLPWHEYSGRYAPLEAVRFVTLADLRLAMLGEATNYGRECELGLSLDPTERFSTSDSWQERPYFTVGLDGRLIIAVDDLVLGDEDEEGAELLELVGPLLRAAGATSVEVDVSSWPFVSLRFELPKRGRTVEDAYRLGEAIVLLVDAAREGIFTPQSALMILRAGRPDLLLGQPESSWLEAKRMAYELARDAGRIELAQDVARFANAEAGGLLVVGIATHKALGVDTLSAVMPWNATAATVGRYRAVLNQRSYPPPDDLTAEVVNVKVTGGQLLVIHVPPQPEELKPFLVQGAIVNGKVEGAFISIVRRRGEDSVPITAQAIHSTLAAGRALLRRGHIVDPAG